MGALKCVECSTRFELKPRANRRTKFCSVYCRQVGYRRRKGPLWRQAWLPQKRTVSNTERVREYLQANLGCMNIEVANALKLDPRTVARAIKEIRAKKPLGEMRQTPSGK